MRHSYYSYSFFKNLNLVLFCIILSCLTVLVQAQAQIKTMNGFDLSKLSINQQDIFSGGPPRDGIP
ncbi:MAG: hypothetical protein QM500_07660, partial [Methylococcales bacterium]